MDLDPELAAAKTRTPDGVVDVVVTCDDMDAGRRRALEAAGLQITDAQSADVGIVAGRIRLRDLDRLARVPGIESVSQDSEQVAF